jgi:Dockerin type I domain/Bacterial Ig domain
VARPRLEGLEDRLVLSLVAVSASDTKVNVSSPLGQTVPSVAMDANGDYVVAWNNQVHLGPNYLYDVEARVYNSAGVPQTGEIVVAQTTGDTRPSVAMDPNGDFVVAYQVLNITTYLYGVSAQRFNLAGQAQGGVITINDGSSDSASGSLPKVAIDSAGDFTIAYQGYDSNSHGVFAQQFNSSGTAQGSIFRVNTPQTDNQGAPSIAMDSAGNFVIAWLDGGTAQSAGVYAQRYNSSGVAQGGNTAISTVAGASDPSVAMEPTGQYVIAWQFTQTANTPGIEAQRFDAGGNALTGVVPLSSPESYFQTNPTVAIDSEGDFVVAWESDGVNGTASSLGTILAQRVNSGGSLIGPTQFLPSTETTSGSQTGAMIASNAGGNAIIVWQTTPAANTFNVFSRLYNYVNDAPTINTPSNVTINENAGQQTVNLTGITAGGGETQTLTVTASSNNTALINPSVTYTSPNSTGTLTFTPAANSFGTATITVTVMDNGGTLNGGVDETSVQFTVTVNQVVIPPTIDTPSNVTIDENAGEQTVNLTGITSGAAGNVTLTVAASSNNTALIPTPAVTYTSPNSTGTLTFTPTANTFGTATITVTVSDDGGANTTSVHFTVTVDQVAATVTAVSADWGTSGTIALQTAADGLRLLPAGRNTDLPWYGINKLQITLSQAESLSPSDVSVTGITVANYGPVTISGSGTNYTITFAQAITTADRVTVTIGNAGIATYTRRLDVLPGDVNDDGVVNAQDLALVHNDFNSIGAVYNIFDDIDGSGVVDITDYSLVGRFVGKKLPVV